MVSGPFLTGCNSLPAVCDDNQALCEGPMNTEWTETLWKLSAW